jgi:hypothetical protein
MQLQNQNQIFLPSLGGISAGDTYLFIPSVIISGSTNLRIALAVSGASLLSFDNVNAATASTDALNWTDQGSADGNLVALAFGSGLYVGAGIGGDIQTSPDGVSWTSRTSHVSGVLRSVIFAGGKFVAVGDGGSVSSSADGITWTAGSAGSSNYRGVAFDGSVYCAVGLSAAGRTSTDGITWTNRAPHVTGDFSAIAAGAGVFVGVGVGGLAAVGSLGGSAWRDISGNLGSHDITGIDFGNGHFAACNSVGEIWVSTDGTNWQKALTDPNIDFESESDIIFWPQTKKWLVLETFPPV